MAAEAQHTTVANCFPDKTCEVCGAPATQSTLDTVSRFNVATRYDKIEPDGDRRYRCDDHLREPQTRRGPAIHPDHGDDAPPFPTS